MRETRRYPAIVAGHRHPEAFCLMAYRTDDGLLTEILWNSRDGVTPFCIASADGRNMTHVMWERDRYSPDHRPTPGQRIFVTLSEERAAELARERVDYWWDHHEFPASQLFASREEAVASFTRDYWRDGQAPTIVTVRDDGTW
jgi:hypothetical protein